MGRRWVPLVIVVFGGLLGLAVAGFPSRRSDAPIQVRTDAVTSTSTPLQAVATTTAPTPASTAASSPPTSLRPAGDVSVRVFNASAVTGAATRVGARIRAGGWDVIPPGADRKAQNDSVVMYRPDYDDEARALAAALALPTAAVVPLDTTVVSPGDAEVAVVVGDELAERLA